MPLPLTPILTPTQEFYALSRDQPLTDDPVDIHENEFRAYILLMNLPDADCMRSAARGGSAVGYTTIVVIT